MRRVDSIAQRPWLGPGLLALVLLAGAAFGNYWLVAASTMLVLVAVLFLVHEREARLSATVAFFVANYLNVAIFLVPEERNYPAYAIILLSLAAVSTSMRGGLRIDVTVVFLAWLLVAGARGMFSAEHDPFYEPMLMPLGALSLYVMLNQGTRDATRYFMVGLLAWAGLEASLGIIQTVFDLPGVARWGARVYTEPRNYFAAVVPGVRSMVRMATGTFPHFNGLGSLLAVVVPIALWRFTELHTPKRFLYLALVVAGLVCTFSRGALIGALIGCLIVVYSSERDPGMRQVRLWFGVLATAVTATALAATVTQYAQSTENLGIRVATWSAVFGEVTNDTTGVLIGKGLNFFRAGFLGSQTYTASSVHSAPIQLFAEAGLIGAVLGAASVLTVIAIGMRANDSARLALSAGVVAFTVHQLFDNAFFGVTGIAVVGLLAVIKRERSPGVSLVEGQDERESELARSTYPSIRTSRSADK